MTLLKNIHFSIRFLLKQYDYEEKLKNWHILLKFIILLEKGYGIYDE